jgi:hypothetical protein
MDIIRDIDTGIPQPILLHWSLLETVTRLVLHEPNEVCGRMDDTFRQFCALDKQQKTHPTIMFIPWLLIHAAVCLDKTAVLVSFLRHARLEKWRSDTVTVQRVIPWSILMFATVESRMDMLKRYRRLLDYLPAFGRQYLAWIALFRSTRECFEYLFTDCDCGAIIIPEHLLTKQMRLLFAARNIRYLDLADWQKREFAVKVSWLPASSQLYRYVWGLPYATPDQHSVALRTDLDFVAGQPISMSNHRWCRHFSLGYATPGVSRFVTRRERDPDDEIHLTLPWEGADDFVLQRVSNSKYLEPYDLDVNWDDECWRPDTRDKLLAHARAMTVAQIEKRNEAVLRKWGHPVNYDYPPTLEEEEEEEEDSGDLDDDEDPTLGGFIVPDHDDDDEDDEGADSEERRMNAMFAQRTRKRHRAMVAAEAEYRRRMQVHDDELMSFTASTKALIRAAQKRATARRVEHRGGTVYLGPPGRDTGGIRKRSDLFRLPPRSSPPPPSSPPHVVHNPYAEDMESSEVAAILAEEEELEYADDDDNEEEEEEELSSP